MNNNNNCNGIGNDNGNDSRSTCVTMTMTTCMPIDRVLGLHCLSIVLSYLNEYEGTSFLLCRKQYWTDTILPLYRIQQRQSQSQIITTRSDTTTTTATTTATKNKNQQNQTQNQKMAKTNKYRHTFKVVKIPDASTRLDRLNTRRLNIRRWSSTSSTGSSSNVIQMRQQTQQTTTTQELAETEWNETVVGVIPPRPVDGVSSAAIAAEATEDSDSEEKKSDNHNNDEEELQQQQRRLSTIMNPPLLRFYDATANSPRTSFQQSSQSSLFKHGTTIIASYPRSGNTLLRSLLETTTGFVTSSDTRPDRNLSKALAEKPPYFVGEGLAPNFNNNDNSSNNVNSPLSPFLSPSIHSPSNSTNNHQRQSPKSSSLSPPPICKTHWPERIGCHTYHANRVILLVRNPFDAADSYWHMNLTNTHTEKAIPSITNDHHHKFYLQLIRHEIIHVWTSFLDYYWKECTNHSVPLLMVRYEDLLLNQRHELQRILKFCCTTTGSGSGATANNNNEDWWKQRLEEVTKKSDERRYGYRSSSTTTSTSTISTSASAISTTSTCNVGADASSAGADTDTDADSNSHPSIGRSLRSGLFPSTLLRDIHDEFDNQNHNSNHSNDDDDDVDDDVAAAIDTIKEGGDDGNGDSWLERLGYHVYKQGFPNNLNKLPPVPELQLKEILPTTNKSNSTNGTTTCTNNGSGSGSGIVTNGDDGTIITNPISHGRGTLTINQQDISLELRSRDSPFGRNMRRWRRKYTSNDTKPFPTV